MCPVLDFKGNFRKSIRNSTSDSQTQKVSMNTLRIQSDQEIICYFIEDFSHVRFLSQVTCRIILALEPTVYFDCFEDDLRISLKFLRDR